MLLALLLLAGSAQASITFLTPQSGGQAIGPTLLEVTTDAAGVDRVEFFVDGVMAGVARKAPFRIAYDFGTSLEARSITAKVWSNDFRKSESATIRTAAVSAGEQLNVDLVEVPLRIRSTRGVKKEDLRVRENGVDQTIRDVHATRPPAHFAFVIDRSLSMSGGKLDAALRAVDEALGQLRAGDTASVVLFNHNVAKAQPVTRGVAKTFADVVPSGGTSLRDALASIAARQRTYAIAITDGGDRNSALAEDEALRRISTTKTTLHALVLGDSHVRFLDRAAANTGGSVIATSEGALARDLRSVLADINSRYVVVYQSAGTRAGWRKIEVTSKKAEIVSARKGYFAE